MFIRGKKNSRIPDSSVLFSFPVSISSSTVPILLKLLTCLCRYLLVLVIKFILSELPSYKFQRYPWSNTYHVVLLIEFSIYIVTPSWALKIEIFRDNLIYFTSDKMCKFGNKVIRLKY